MSSFSVTHAAAIRAALTKDSLQSVEIYMEALDLYRFRGDVHTQRLTGWLENKYRDLGIDAIIAEGPEALDFGIKFRSALKQAIPVVFTGVADYYIKRMTLPPNVTGVASIVHVSDWVKTATALVPSAREIVVLGDAESQSTDLVDISREFIELESKRNINLMTGMPIRTVVSRIDSLPEDAVILYLGMSTDDSGQYFLPEDLVAIIARLANRPIFVALENYLGSGAVGGLVMNATEGTHEVAEMARLVLNGKDASTIPILYMDRRKPVFDARALKKWGIPLDALPAGSALRNYEPTLWEQYSLQIVFVVMAFILQGALIVALILEYRRRRKAELKFRRSMSDLAHLNRTTALGELSASIAHELNQPLAAILSNAEAAELFLGTTPPGIAEVRDALSDIRRDNQRASDIIRGMRSLFRKSDFVASAIDVNDVIEEIVKFVTWEARSKHIEIAKDLAGNLPPVAADRIHLQQVILNLVMNAIEAAQKTSKAIHHVSVVTRLSASNTVEICVEDNGPGIPDEMIEHIFDPYYTTKSHGMGMGLSICRTIIELHGSRLRVRNIEGGGAGFCFKLGRAKST